MKHVQIENPCSENWAKMNVTQKGAFCKKCATEVLDFTNKSQDEIKSIFRGLAGQSVCGRIADQQLALLNSEFENWQNLKNSSSFQSMWIFSLIVVFGLTLFSCETEKDRKIITKIQSTFSKVITEKQTDDQEFTKEDLQDSKEINVEQMNTVGYLTIDPVVYDELQLTNSDSIMKIEESEEIYSTIISGDMSMTRLYITYLNETNPVVNEIEYDQNGIAIPFQLQTKLYPNPAITSTTFEIGLPLKDIFQIQLFDVSGKWIQDIHLGELDRGTHRFPIEIIDYPDGMYLVVVQSEKYKETIRVVK